MRKEQLIKAYNEEMADAYEDLKCAESNFKESTVKYLRYLNISIADRTEDDLNSLRFFNEMMHSYKRQMDKACAKIKELQEKINELM